LVPESSAALTNVGFSLSRQDRHQDAIEACRAAHELERAHGGDADAFLNYGVALADSSRTQEAIAVFESALPQGMQKYDPFLSFIRGWPATSAPQMQHNF